MMAILRIVWLTGQFFLGVIPTAQAGGLVWGIREQCAEKMKQNSFYQEESYRWSGVCAFYESANGIWDHSTSVHNSFADGPIRWKGGQMPVHLTRMRMEIACRRLTLFEIRMDLRDQIHGEFDSISPAEV
jgi:hypothetical protein